MMRRLENSIKKYGPEFGPICLQTLESHAEHAQVASRLRRKLDILIGKVLPAAESEKPLSLITEEALESSVSIANVESTESASAVRDGRGGFQTPLLTSVW